MILDNIPEYDGLYIKTRFAYDHFKDKAQPVGNIIAFISPIHIPVCNMTNKDDILLGTDLNIEMAINFCIELPNTTAFGGECFHRLFNSNLGNMIAANILHCDVEISGKDVIIYKETEEHGIIRTHGVASISHNNNINNTSLLYTGIQLIGGKHAPITSYSVHMNDTELLTFVHSGIELFYGMAHEIFIETTKQVM